MRLYHLACTVVLATIGTGATTIDAHEPEENAQQYCKLFTKVRDTLSARFGSNVDPMTRFSGIEVICDHKAMVFRQDVSLRSSDIDRDWVARRTRHWSKTYCGRHAAFAGAIRNGWTISTVLSLADGQVLRIDAACHDAEV
jgi:hypothetical protein